MTDLAMGAGESPSVRLRPSRSLTLAVALGVTVAFAPNLASAQATGTAKGAPLAPLAESTTYPTPPRGDLVTDYFGSGVPAPYRWMEDLNSSDVKAWVDAENKVTFSYLDQVPIRSWMRTRLRELWDYEKVGVPDRVGGKLYYTRNSGLQNQSVVYVQGSLDGQPKELLDPNALSPDGSVALADWQPSPDGRYLAYGLSQGGSDWREFHIKEVASGTDLPETLKWIKFSGVSWTNDGEGFYYARFAEPPTGEAISEQVTNQKVYYHRLGTPQVADPLIFERPDKPDWYVGAGVSEDGRYLFVYMNHGTETSNELYYADLGDPDDPNPTAEVRPLYTKNDAEYQPIGTEGSTLYLQTNLNAPNRRIVAADLSDPAPAHWRTVVPEGQNVIDGSLLAGGRIAVQYLVDVKSQVTLFGTDGTREGELDLPGIGTVAGLSGRDDTPEIFYAFSSFLYPTTVYHYETGSGETRSFHAPDVPFDPSRYETRQVFYTSRDGTRVPMFITARKDLKLDGRNPTTLYAYGGFDINNTPRFSPIVPVWLEMGGVYAVANLRGGGEYGQAWHEAGMLGNKQNVFDDFIAAAEYLQDQKITSPSKLSIQGYSNGGLLVGATVTQRPDLFAAAYAGAGVMDMLRYQKFSAGIGWVPEYGSSDDPKAFQWLHAYSPLHNLRQGVCYPATIITTADHDDRVVPSHSYKFAAEMQHDQGCRNPVLIRVETQTSHGYMPTDKRIAQTSDIWAFLAYELGVESPPDGAASSASGGTSGGGR